jgi:4'-phosphopantetheinyl transferase
MKPGEVLVWRARLDEIPAGTLPPLLPAEAERAARFHSDEARRRYTRSHGVLRTLLGRLGLPTVFARDGLGKPRLASPDVWFNLSRSHGMALYAFARDAAVGVDIERLRPLPEHLAIAERFLPPSHYAALVDAPPGEREREFFRLWTRLEAALKAAGSGLYGAGQELEGEWTVEEIGAGDGFAAAVAVRAAGCRLLVSDFE